MLQNQTNKEGRYFPGSKRFWVVSGTTDRGAKWTEGLLPPHQFLMFLVFKFVLCFGSPKATHEQDGSKASLDANSWGAISNFLLHIYNSLAQKDFYNLNYLTPAPQPLFITRSKSLSSLSKAVKKQPGGCQDYTPSSKQQTSGKADTCSLRNVSLRNQQCEMDKLFK